MICDFVVAQSIEETYDVLRKTWWGTAESLHLDAWGELVYVMVTIYPYGLKVILLRFMKKLYFLNLGGYDSKQFTELHHNVFIIAQDKQAPK